MIDLQHSPYISTQLATDIIIGACKLSPNRESVKSWGYSVSFVLLIDGSHEAIARNPKGVVVAISNVYSTDN